MLPDAVKTNGIRGISIRQNAQGAISGGSRGGNPGRGEKGRAGLEFVLMPIQGLHQGFETQSLPARAQQIRNKTS